MTKHITQNKMKTHHLKTSRNEILPSLSPAILSPTEPSYKFIMMHICEHTQISKPATTKKIAKNLQHIDEQ